MSEKMLTMITITEKEYDKLRKSDLILTALENGGVDDWEWYSESIKQFKQILKDEGNTEDLDLLDN